METWVIVVGLIALALIASSAYQQNQIKETFQSTTMNIDWAKQNEKYVDQLKDVDQAKQKYLRELGKLPGQPSYNYGSPYATPYTSPYVGPGPTVYGPSTVFPNTYVQPLPGPTQTTYLPTQTTYLPQQTTYLPQQTTYGHPPTVVTPNPTQIPVGYYPSTYSSLSSTPLLGPTAPSSTDPPSVDVCNHLAQNVCVTPECVNKQYNDCINGNLNSCDNHAAHQCRAYSAQNTPNSPQGTQSYNDCLTKAKAECLTHGAV